MTDTARRKRGPTTRAELALWLHRAQRRLHRRIERMPEGTMEYSIKRLGAAVSGSRKIGARYRQLKAKLAKGDRND